MQLVGQSCVHCQQRIPTDIDGRFCPRCGSAVHLECEARVVAALTQGSCRKCGAPASVLKAMAKAQEEKEEDATGRQGLQTVALGFAVLVGGLMFSMCCTGLAMGAGTGRFVVATGAIFGGVAIIIGGMLQSARR